MLSAVRVADADVVTLSDGSRIVCTIERMTDDTLLIDTAFSGKIEIDAAQVQSIATELPVKVALNSGDRLVGVVASQANDGHAVVQTAMGPIGIDLVNVNHLWPIGGKSPETIAHETELVRINAETRAQRPRWSATVEAGVNSQEGNTEILEARGRAELKRTTSDDVLSFYLSGDYGEQNKRRSRAEVKGGASYEYSLSERWVWRASLSMEYDEFENLDLRTIISTGPGYYWIKKPNHELKNRVGIGYQHETFLDGVTTDEALLDIGLEYRVDLLDWLQFKNTSDYYPSFEGLDNYRLVFDSALIIPLAGSDRWKLKFGALYEYDSAPRPGIERFDQTYYANVMVEIK